MKMTYDLILSLVMVSCKLNIVSRKGSLHIQQSPLEISSKMSPSTRDAVFYLNYLHIQWLDFYTFLLS